jgi:hypothetical protein
MKKPNLKRMLETDPVEVGFLSLDERSRIMVDATLPRIERILAGSFPQFNWKFEHLHQPEEPQEPVRTLPLLDRSYLKSLERHWDFCFTVGEMRLDPRDSRSGWGRLSLAHSSVVLSLFKLIPLAQDSEATQTIFTNLAVDYFGRLSGLGRSRPETILDPDKQRAFSATEQITVQKHLRMVAEISGEEKMKEASRAAWSFKVLFRHPLKIGRMVVANRPWAMIFGSGKIVFATLATLILSIMAVEFWDLGMSQSIWRSSLLGVGVIIFTTIYVLKKHDLLALGEWTGLNEQMMMRRVSTILTILTGFLLLFLVIFTFNLLFCALFFPSSVIDRWLETMNISTGMHLSLYIRVSLLASCLALAVAGLGAGLEDNSYFLNILSGPPEK